MFFLAVICVWRLRCAAGIALLIAGIALGVLLVPAYLQARGNSIGEDAAKPQPGQIFIPSDRWRLQAWSAAARMWEAAPLTGSKATRNSVPSMATTSATPPTMSLGPELVPPRRSEVPDGILRGLAPGHRVDGTLPHSDGDEDRSEAERCEQMGIGRARSASLPALTTRHPPGG